MLAGVYEPSITIGATILLDTRWPTSVMLRRGLYGRAQEARPVPNTCPKTKTSPLAEEGTSKGTSP